MGFKTFKDIFISHLVDHGMSEQQAGKVFEQAKTHKSNETMIERWNDDVSDYPKIMQNLVILSANRAAIIWIDRELPAAWYRPMFEQHSC